MYTSSTPASSCHVAVPRRPEGLADRFLSEIRVVASLFNNVFAIAVVARWMGELDDERLPVVLDGDPASDFEPLDEFAQARQEKLRASIDRAGYRCLASRVGGASR
jgi:hypothetical protein